MLDSPPDGMVFGGSRDGLTKMVKPRGRVGNTRATTDASSGNGTSEMMNVAMLALLAKVTDAMGPPSSSSSGVAGWPLLGSGLELVLLLLSLADL